MNFWDWLQRLLGQRPRAAQTTPPTAEETRQRIRREHEALGAWSNYSGQPIAKTAMGIDDSASSQLMREVIAYNGLPWWKKLFTRSWRDFFRYGRGSRNYRLCLYLGGRVYLSNGSQSPVISLWGQRQNFLLFLDKSRLGRGWRPRFRSDDILREEYHQETPLRDLWTELVALQLRAKIAQQKFHRSKTWVNLAKPLIAEVEAGRQELECLRTIDAISRQAHARMQLIVAECQEIFSIKRQLFEKKCQETRANGRLYGSRVCYDFMRANKKLTATLDTLIVQAIRAGKLSKEVCSDVIRVAKARVRIEQRRSNVGVFWSRLTVISRLIERSQQLDKYDREWLSMSKYRRQSDLCLLSEEDIMYERKRVCEDAERMGLGALFPHDPVMFNIGEAVRRGTAVLRRLIYIFAPQLMSPQERAVIAKADLATRQREQSRQVSCGSAASSIGENVPTRSASTSGRRPELLVRGATTAVHNCPSVDEGDATDTTQQPGHPHR